MHLNHSCEPNLGLQGQIAFVAMRDIAADEELTFDYAMTDDEDIRDGVQLRRSGLSEGYNGARLDEG